MSPKMLIACAASALAGVAFVLSCGDDSPSDVDAATCDCPAAEPPLDGRIMTTTGTPQDLAANATTGLTLACPAGAQLLSGGCGLSGAVGVPDASLISSEGSGTLNTWACDWANRGPDILQGTVTVTCLMPAQ